MSGPERIDGEQESSHTRPWDWRIDLPPPLGPDREPVPDPAATAGVDAPATPGGLDSTGSTMRDAGDAPDRDVTDAGDDDRHRPQGDN